MTLFYFLSAFFLFAGLVGTRACLLVNKYILNSVWDIFYILSILICALLWIYYNFFSFEIPVLWDVKILFLMILLFVIDLKVDTYFDLKEYHDLEKISE